MRRVDHNAVQDLIFSISVIFFKVLVCLFGVAEVVLQYSKVHHISQLLAERLNVCLRLGQGLEKESSSIRLVQGTSADVTFPSLPISPAAIPFAKAPIPRTAPF